MPTGFDAGRPATDDRERHQRGPAPGIFLHFRTLERQQDPAPQLGRILDALQPRRNVVPVVVAETVVRRAGGDDQAVVADAAPAQRTDFTLPPVDTRDRVEQHADVVEAADDAADRRGDPAPACQPPAFVAGFRAMEDATRRDREQYRDEDENKGSWLLDLPGVRRMRQLHLSHHDPAIMQRGNFNITWPICDRLFGTRVLNKASNPSSSTEEV